MIKKERERESRSYFHIYLNSITFNRSSRSRAIDLCRRFLSTWLLISVPKGNRARYLIYISDVYTAFYLHDRRRIARQDEIPLYKIFSARIKSCARSKLRRDENEIEMQELRCKKSSLPSALKFVRRANVEPLRVLLAGYPPQPDDQIIKLNVAVITTVITGRNNAYTGILERMTHRTR